MQEINSVAVIGLGYVGLPLVVEFGKTIKAVGFDIAKHKVQRCRDGIDPSGELSAEAMAAGIHAVYTDDPSALGEVDAVIVAVPTPVDDACQPNFTPLVEASKSVARHMKDGCIVIYESTVHPGATEEICVPVLEQFSGKKWKQDFFVGYSPERINPGDQEHTLVNVIKVVAGDNEQTLERIAHLYERIVCAGVHRTRSIKVAEASKVIENTQRDLNIALMNELAIIFDKVGIDTNEVLEAAGTKWNFLKFKPGLVGGHCIGVDPYYLTHKAEKVGYHPQVILAGRRINDGMGKFIAEQTVKNMIEGGCCIKGARVNLLGITFKEDCADIRNSKAVDIIKELRRYGVEVFIHDPNANSEEVREEYGLELCHWENLPQADAVVLSVAHRCYTKFGLQAWEGIIKRNGCFVDVKAALPQEALYDAGYHVWRL